MLESMGSVFNRMDQIQKRIETISKIPSKLPIRRIRPYRSVEKEENETTKGPKFSDVLQEVLNRKRANSDQGLDQTEDSNHLSEIFSSNLGGQKKALDLDQIIQQASLKYGVDSDLIRAMIQQESGFSQKALSPKGALGLMQLMPKTADLLGVNPTDPFENVMGGTRYFKMLMDKYNGDIGRSLAAYNAGPNRVDQAGGIPNIRETKDYVRKVMTFYRQNRMEHEAGNE